MLLAVNGPFTGKTSVIGKLSPLSLGIKLDGYFESLEVNDGDSLDIVGQKPGDKHHGDD